MLDYVPVDESSDEDDVFPRQITAGFHAVTYATATASPTEEQREQRS